MMSEPKKVTEVIMHGIENESRFVACITELEAENAKLRAENQEAWNTCDTAEQENAKLEAGR